MKGESVLWESGIDPLFLRVKSLRANIGHIPSEYAMQHRSLFDWPGSFDANRYLEVFDLLRLDPDFVLDYVYEWTGIGGFPLLYVRGANSPRLSSAEKYREKFVKIKRGIVASQLTTERLHLEHLTFDKTAFGFFQFALFCLEAPKFYLSWHDNYYDTEFVCSPSRLEELLADIPREAHNPLLEPRVMPEDKRQQLRSLDLRPQVTIKGDSAEVRVVSFTKWGGFAYYSSHVTWPHYLDKAKREVIVPYHCGIVY